MTRHEPRVSVVIPAYQAADFLADALDSVFAQSVVPTEVVVVDDGSTDGTAAVCAGFSSVRLVAQDHAGAGVARNRGVAETSGELVAFLDADDVWAPAKLERQLAALDADPGAAAVLCGARNVRWPAPAPGDATGAGDAPAAGMVGLPSALLVRRAALHDVGPFATALLWDWVDWYLRLQESGHRVLVLDEVLVDRRVHGANTTLRQRDQRVAYARMIKASLDRRRRAAALQPGAPAPLLSSSPPSSSASASATIDDSAGTE